MTDEQEETAVRGMIVLMNAGVDVTLKPCPFTGAPENTFSNKNLPPVSVPSILERYRRG